MTATDKTLLENSFLETEAKNLKDSHFISHEQCRQIKMQLPVPKTNANILVRFGFFILGVLLYSSLSGVISLFGLSALDSALDIFVFIYAIIGFVGSEILARNNYHAHGLDDAFVLGFQLCFCAAIGFTTENTTAVFITMAVSGLFCSIRYVHTISCVAAMIGIAGAIGTLITEYGIVDKMFLSFGMLFLAILLYFIYQKLAADQQLYIYKNPINAIQIFSLILGYLSVNYLVVREMSQVLMGLMIDGNNDIPLAWLFYGFTFLIPILLVVFGLLKKNRVMLILGLIAFAFAIFTIRYYHSIMPLETALILGGIGLFAVSLICIRKLKHKETGITFKKDRYADSESFAFAQAIIVNSQANISASQTPESPITFGGGGFSGGGSSESF